MAESLYRIDVNKSDTGASTLRERCLGSFKGCFIFYLIVKSMILTVQVSQLDKLEREADF